MAEVKKEWSSILVGKCNEPKMNEDGTPWLIPFGIPKEQYEEMGTLINERGWVNGALRHTKAGNWVVQINKPEPLKENASQEADGLPF
jgi:hypothetical protein|tara:strand:+ start:1447 stop:1710 length:264 start_codon:yes stop_codon:yes gene_type:complete